MKIKFTTIKSVYDNEIGDANLHSMSWDRFTKILSKPLICPNKADAPLLSPVEYFSKQEAIELTDNGCVRRCADNVKSWYMLAIDIDGQMTIDEAVEKFSEYTYVLYSTYSHRTEEKPYDCFRLFMPLFSPVTNIEFQSRIPAIRDFIGNHDKTTLASSRGFYVPSHKEGRHVVYHHNEGKCVDLMLFEPEIEEIYVTDTSREPPSEEFKTKVLNELFKLREIEYDLWWKIGSAMQSSGYSEMQFQHLSSVIRAHRKNNCRMQWRCSKRKKIGFGFLVNVVKEMVNKDAFKHETSFSENKEINLRMTRFRDRLPTFKY